MFSAVGRAPLRQERFARVLHGELEVVDATTLNTLEEGQLISHFVKGLRVVLISLLIVGDRYARDIRVNPALEIIGDQALQQRIGNKSDNHSHGNREETQNDGISPHGRCLTLWGNVEWFAAKHDDEHLSSTHDNADANEEPILGNALENVESIVQPTVAVWY